MQDDAIFSANYLRPRKPFNPGKVHHWHLEPNRKGATADDQVGTFKTSRKALSVCPDDWYVIPCYSDHPLNRPETPESWNRSNSSKSSK